MASEQRLEKRYAEIDAMTEFMGMTPAQLLQYKVYLKTLLSVEIQMHKFLNGILGSDPMTLEERERLEAMINMDEYVSVTHGDDMCENQAEGEIYNMSDFELVRGGYLPQEGD